MLLRVLTVLALLALAIGTWMLSNQSRIQRSTGPIPQNQLPGYFLKDAVMTDYSLAGDPAVRIAAGRIEQIDHTNDVALLDVRLEYQGDEGQQWVLFGDHAHVRDAGRVVDLDGNVRLQGLEGHQPGPALVTTDHAAYDVPSSEIRTGSEVHMTFGEHTLSARGLVARLKERTIRLESGVYGRFIP